MTAKAKRKLNPNVRVLCANGSIYHANAGVSASQILPSLWLIDLQGCGPHRVEVLVDGRWESP